MAGIQSGEVIVIRYGGSILVPDAVDMQTLLAFKKVLESYIKENNNRFYVVVGGGQAARMYQDALAQVPGVSEIDIHWIGLHTNNHNTRFVRMVFGDLAYPNDLDQPSDAATQGLDYPVVTYGAFKPGHSSNWDAVLIARAVGAKTVINLSNIEKVYTADPKKDPNAQPIDDITWEEYMKLIPEHHAPKMSVPFDPPASREAVADGMQVVFMAGRNMENLTNYLEGKEFTGTLIHP